MSRTRGKYKWTQEIIKEHNLHVLVYVSYTCKVSGKWGSENNFSVFLKDVCGQATKIKQA